MKRTFLRILPLAVAVLLATSCSKDENNDNAVVNNGQETVQTKTLPISITVNQKGLSKLSSANITGEALQPIFETSDKLAIYNGGTFLTELAIKEGSISQDGKTATFEGEITAEGIVEGETILTATIGTQITEAQTATSRENAVKQGCYQTAEFTYFSTGNTIALTEQNSYIEVVWTNKEGQSVDFTINDSKTVSLQLNDKGQGWIVVPAGTKFTCAALGLTDETTTAAANIYGINREFSAVPEGYVDLGVKVDDKSVFWAQNNLDGTYLWENAKTAASNNDAELPTKADFQALANACHWVWQTKDGVSGMYAFKLQGTDQSNYKSPANEFDATYKADGSVPYIFLPAVFYGGKGYYWSSTPSGSFYAYCLAFDSGLVDPECHNFSVEFDYSVRLVRRSN